MSTADKTRSRSQPVGWDQQTLTQPHERHDKATRVEAMFNAIAPTYERVNTLASFGQDARWRRRAVRSVQLSGGETILDVCCGTGDVIRTFAVNDPAPGRIIGLDFAREMLDSGRYAGITTPIELIHGDALNLPLGEQSVDVISCAFGVRNFQDLGRGLSEMWRVLRPGGKAVILEFTMPWNPLLRWAHKTYTNTVLPRLGAWVARDQVQAYRYLPRSIETFATTAEMIAALKSVGFERVTARTMNLGGVAIYRADRP
jgi:demethylmenaquinone methyltransferase/2-methoxy-6-polyprenyl-1,4-benzoquinol methylase